MNNSLAPTIHRNWVLHDYMQVNGGAERLASTIARGYAGFSLGVSGIYPDFSESADLSEVDLRLLGRLPMWLPRIPRALLTFGQHLPCIENANVVIYSGVYTPLAIQSQKQGKRIYYCNTPPRFAFDRKNEYLQKVPNPMRYLVDVAIDAYRQAYTRAVAKMDVVLTNSDHVRKRMANLLEVATQVVYPPVDIDAFKWKSQGDYYLSLGRLEPNKRIDRVVKAFMRMPEKKLIVASGGSQLESLRKLANGYPNITFVGWLRDEDMTDLIVNALACVYIPFDEDFGMSAVESSLLDMISLRMGEFASGVIASPFQAICERAAMSFGCKQFPPAALFHALEEAGWVDVGMCASRSSKTKKHVFCAPEFAHMSKSSLRDLAEQKPVAKVVAIK